MNRFFRDNFIGVLLLSAAGSLIASLIARVMSTSTSGGVSFVAAVSRPIPVCALFPYSVLLVLAFALWALRTRHKDQRNKITEQSVLKDQIATVQGERDAIRQQLDAVAKETEQLRQQLNDARSSTVSRPDLMRFVAVVLSTTQGSSLNLITHEYVCKHVAGLAGQGTPHAAISEALASMLHIGAVASDYSGLLLVKDWKDKMRAAGVPDVFPSVQPRT